MDEQPQAQAGEPKPAAKNQGIDLTGLAAARFGTLSAAEGLLLEKVVTGEMANCSQLDDKGSDPKQADDWTPGRRMRAELLAWLCFDEQARKQVHARGIPVYGADITGPLDLSFVNIPFQLGFAHCRFQHDLHLISAEVLQLDLHGSSARAIMADGLVVRNDVFLREGFTASGGVRLVGAQIGGAFDCHAGTFTNEEDENQPSFNADRINVKGPVFLCNGFTASGEVRLVGAQIGGDLDCAGGTFINEKGRSLTADGINVKGAVLLRARFTADSEVRLQGAQIAGNLECDGGTFTNASGIALQANEIDVRGYVLLRHSTCNGEVRLVGAQIGGNLECDAGTLTGAGGYAIVGDGIKVRGAVFLRNGFTANGEVWLVGAQIAGNLECNSGTFTNPSGSALCADRIKVDGDVFLGKGFTANGEVGLVGAQIGGNLECNDGTFTNPGGYALKANSIGVKGSVFLGRGPNAAGSVAPFIATGEVNLDVAQIDGGLSCVGGVFSNPEGNALSAYRSIVKSSLFLGEGLIVDGGVSVAGAQIGGTLDCTNRDLGNATLDLRDASAGTLVDSGLNDIPSGTPADSPPTIWPQPGHLFLDGFTYGRISSEGRIDVDKRLQWLGLQPEAPFRPQPYLQLARILRDAGDSKRALRVLEKMEDLRRNAEQRGPVAHVWNLILKGTIGYGYYPKRAIWALAFLVVLGWVVYARSYPARIAPTDKVAYEEFRKGKLPAHYPAFSAPIYSLENSLPLVKLGQADKWQPDPAAAWPPLERWFLRFQILLGWMLATFFVAGVSGIVHKE